MRKNGNDNVIRKERREPYMAHEILSVKMYELDKNWNRPTVGFSWRRVWIRKDSTNRSRIFDRNVRKAVSLWKTDFAIPRQTV